MPYEKSEDGKIDLGKIKSVIIDTKFADEKDERGLTQIPPTLREFGTTFADDLQHVLGSDVSVSNGENANEDSIFITLDSDGDYNDAAGKSTSEGYSLTLGRHGATISGASPLGAWWGTRSLLQQIVLQKDRQLSFGKGSDSPGWRDRGMMLDCARHFYPKDFIIDMCAYMSFFKQNTLQLHLSDNTIVPTYTKDNYNEAYARFRLWSDSEEVRGLNKHYNESYTKSDFDDIQTKCARRGVTIIPEIEAPGHALPIVQWRPQIGYEGDLSLLDISHPDTIPTMKSIWKEFLPWFHTKAVSIGADEYKGPEDDYKRFVNTMASFINAESEKDVRIWGTFPPKQSTLTSSDIFTNVTIQHWSYLFDNPYEDYIKRNYSVINSDEMFYVVMKDGPYGRVVNTSITFDANPEDGGPWYPHIFSLNNTSDNPKRDNSFVQGSIAPLWNDHGANTSVYSEAYYAWRDGIPALADKQWGGKLTQEMFRDTVEKLRQQIPDQNLERTIESKQNTIFHYDLAKTKSGTAKDSSENNFHAKTKCESSKNGLHMTPQCDLETPLSSKGRNYTLSLSLSIDSVEDQTNATIISGADSVLMLTPNVTLFAAGNYYRLNSTIPMKTLVNLEIRGTGPKTYASAATGDGKELFKDQEFLATISYYGQPLRWHEMAIEAPIQRVRGWTGQLKSLTLTNGDKDDTEESQGASRANGMFTVKAVAVASLLTICFYF